MCVCVCVCAYCGISHCESWTPKPIRYRKQMMEGEEEEEGNEREERDFKKDLVSAAAAR